MTAYDDMLHLKMRNGVGDHGLRAQVRRLQDICNVPVDEDGARREVQESGLGNPGVGAAEPEDGGGLALGEFGQEVGVVGVGLLGPGFVGGKSVVEGIYVRLLSARPAMTGKKAE